MSEDEARPRLRSYGRLQGRTLRPRQEALVQALLPRLEITLPEEGALDPRLLFAQPREVWLEIGFGGGEHLAEQARRHPDIAMIGGEPYLNGVVKLLGLIEAQDLANIRLWRGDARALTDRLPTASIDRVFLLFPDPWPKPRQAGRRFVSSETILALARILVPGGRFRMASDHVGYVEWMLRVMRECPDFTWTANGPEDFLTPPDDWVRTRYQQKTEAQGRAPVFLDYRRGRGSPNVHSST